MHVKVYSKLDLNLPNKFYSTTNPIRWMQNGSRIFRPDPTFLLRLHELVVSDHQAQDGVAIS